MNAKATIKLNEAYYWAMYRDWERYISKWRRWEVPFGVFLVVVGALTFILSLVHWTASALCVLIGGGEIIDYYWSRKRWMRDRLRDKRLDASVILQFEEDRIIHSGPYAHGEFAWEGIDSITPTPTGIFLRPQKGISIYVPDQTLEPVGAKALIVNRINQLPNKAEHAER